MGFVDLAIDFLINFSAPVHYLVIFLVLLACGFGLPIPEDITLILGGVLSYFGLTDVTIMIFVGLAGVMIGDSMVFLLGHRYGLRIARKGPFKRVFTEERVEKVKAMLHQRGNKLIFAARFMPGLRAPIFFTAGCLHLPFRVFFFYDFLAAILSVPAIVGLVFYFGDQLEIMVRYIKRAEHGILIVIVFGIVLIAVRAYLAKRKRFSENA